MISEVCHYLNMTEKEFCLKGRIFTNILNKKQDELFQGESTAQRSLPEAEVEMDRKSWERRNSDIAQYETNQQLESQRLELYQANQWAGQAQQENSRPFGEVSTKNRIHQEHHARDCQDRVKLRKICCKQADRVRRLRIDEVSKQKKQNSSTVNQLLSQIQELQDKVNALNSMILRHRAAQECPTFPANPR